MISVAVVACEEILNLVLTAIYNRKMASFEEVRRKTTPQIHFGFVEKRGQNCFPLTVKMHDDGPG